MLLAACHSLYAILRVKTTPKLIYARQPSLLVTGYPAAVCISEEGEADIQHRV